jgi:hypothetical protein
MFHASQWARELDARLPRRCAAPVERRPAPEPPFRHGDAPPRAPRCVPASALDPSDVARFPRSLNAVCQVPPEPAPSCPIGMKTPVPRGGSQLKTRPLASLLSAAFPLALKEKPMPSDRCKPRYAPHFPTRRQAWHAAAGAVPRRCPPQPTLLMQRPGRASWVRSPSTSGIRRAAYRRRRAFCPEQNPHWAPPWT